jgi:phytoene dehydrogenase-like protein
MDLLRVGPLCLQDWLDEWFSDPVIQGGVSLPALLGTWMGPRSPTGAAALLFSTALAGDEVVGGPAGLVDALKAAAIAAGVNLKTKAQVQRIRVEDGKVAGVSLTDGSYLAATNVLSSIGARKTLLELVDPTRLPFAIERAATPIRLRGIVAKVDLALEDWSWGSRVRIAPSMRYLEKAFDAAKHRRMPEAPGLDIRIPSLEDPGLAPNGQYVASVLVYGAAHDLDGGWTDAARARLGEVVCETMERFLPGSSQKIIAQRTRSPADLEQDYGLEGGHIFHGELGLDQILSFRPHPSLAGYTTPVLGLVLGGAGMHPAGGLTCAQGVLAAQRVR